MTNVSNEVVNNVERRLEAVCQEVRSIQQSLPPHEDDSDVSELLALECVLVDLESQLDEALDEIGAIREGEYSN
jgi:hypothetical protein